MKLIEYVLRESAVSAIRVIDVSVPEMNDGPEMEMSVDADPHCNVAD